MKLMRHDMRTSMERSTRLLRHTQVDTINNNLFLDRIQRTITIDFNDIQI